MKKWCFIHAEGHKVIFASPEVAGLVRSHLADRGAAITEETERESAWVDNPGMCLMNRTLWSAEVDGLKIEMPVTDFHDFLCQVKQHLHDPAFNGDHDPERGYRSVYGWLHCISMTQGQYEALHAAMVASADDVQSSADEENDQLARALAKANEAMKADGLGVSISSPRLDVAETDVPLGGLWN